MRHNRRTFALFFTLALVIAGVSLARYAYEIGFTNKWKQQIIEELERNGFGAEINRLTIDPVHGLIARDVRLYDLANGRRHLADISHISLDVDLSRLVKKEDFLRSMDLRNATLRLPMDPADPNSEVLEIDRLNARLLFEGDRININQATGTIAGIRFQMTGALTKRARLADETQEEERRIKERAQQIAEIQARRVQLREVLRFLDKFTSTEPEKARVELRIAGQLGDFSSLEIDASVRSENLKCGDFLAEAVAADIQLYAGELQLSKLEIRDKHGRLRANAHWRINASKEVAFSADSTVDLHALLKGLSNEPKLMEVVFYEPPKVKLDGTLRTDRPWTEGRWPLQIYAEFETRKHFTTHGVIFEGIKGQAAIKEGNFHVRDVILEHHSGTSTFNVMKTDGEFRCHVLWNMELNAAMPFLQAEQSREWASQFEFGQDSTVLVELNAHGPHMDITSLTGKVKFDLRHFKLREVMLSSVSAAEVTLEQGLTKVTDLVVTRPDGTVKINQAVIDAKTQMLHIENLVSTMPPHVISQCVDRKLAQELSDYRASPPPQVNLSGDIALNPQQTELCDYTVLVRAPGTTSLTVNKERQSFTNVVGGLRRRNDMMAIKFTGLALPGSIYPGVRINEPASVEYTGHFGVARHEGKFLEFNVEAAAERSVDLFFAGKTIPANILKVSISGKNNGLLIKANSAAVGGKLSGTVEFPNVLTDPTYKARVEATGLNNARLTKIFDPASESQGELGGWLDFGGDASREGDIQGTGRVEITDGNIFAIPLLGPLSVVISAMLPMGKLTYNTARSATADFDVDDGVVSIRNFDATTMAFRMSLEGVVDYAHDRVDLSARLNARGAPGLLLFPVSKLLEYEARGTMKTPDWKPKHLRMPFFGSDRVQENKPNGAPR